MVNKHERLVAFLYLLMRDELPAGTVCRIINELIETDTGKLTGYKFTNPHLEAMARSYAARLGVMINEPSEKSASVSKNEPPPTTSKPSPPPPPPPGR